MYVNFEFSIATCCLGKEGYEFTYENAVKHKSTLSAVRNLANIKTGFREAFAESVGSVIELVNSRFKRMKLKNENLEVYTGMSDEDIQSSLDVVSQVLNSVLTVDMPTTELRKVKNLQVNQTKVSLLVSIHVYFRHFTFTAFISNIILG